MVATTNRSVFHRIRSKPGALVDRPAVRLDDSETSATSAKSSKPRATGRRDDLRMLDPHHPAGATRVCPGGLAASLLALVAEARQLRELVERAYALPPLVAHDPGWVDLHAHLLAEIGTGIDTLQVAFHVRHLVRGRPEPGLLLDARRSPVGAVHDRPGLLEVACERPLVAGRARRGRREHEG